MKLSINKNTLESAVLLCNAYVEKKILAPSLHIYFLKLMRINLSLERVILK